MIRTLGAILVCLVVPVVAAAQAGSAPVQAGDTSRISELSWSLDDRLILTSSGDDFGLRVWDVASGAVLWKANVGFLQDDLEFCRIRESTWSRDRRFVATGTTNGKIQLWEVATGRLLWNIRAHGGEVGSMAISPNATALVSAARTEEYTSELKVWRLDDGSLLGDLSAEEPDALAVQFVDESLFRVGTRRGRVTLWSTAELKAVESKQLAPCGVGEKSLFVIAYSRNLTRLATGCDGSLVVMNVVTGDVSNRIRAGEWDQTPLFSGDEKTILVSAGLDVFDSSGRKRPALEGLSGGVLNSDGSLIAASDTTRGDGVHILDTKSGERRGWLVGHPGDVTSLAFSPDGGRFASGSADHVVRIWDTNTKRLLVSCEGHTDDVEEVTFSADGKRLTSRSEREAIVWNTDTGAKIKETKGEFSFRKSDSRFTSPSGRYALVEEYEKPFRLVDARTDRTLEEFIHIDQLDTMAFCPDEEHFLVKPWWRGWQLWSRSGRGPIREFDVGYSSGNVVAFHPNGRTFVTGGSGQNLFMFDLEGEAPPWSLLPIDRDEFEQHRAREERRLASLRRAEERTRRADVETEEYRASVFIAFENFGDATDPELLRLAHFLGPNADGKEQPETTVAAIWFRLHNASPLPIEIPTSIAYDECRFTFPGGREIGGVCSGSEIIATVRLEAGNDDPIVLGSGHFGGRSTVLPGTSVLFAIPRALVHPETTVLLGYRFKNVAEDGEIADFGSHLEVEFRAAEIPNLTGKE